MKVFELMAALAYKPAGEEVVLYVYRESGFDVIECVDFDKDGRVAISNDRILFDTYDKKHYGDEPTMGGE